MLLQSSLGAKKSPENVILRSLVSALTDNIKVMSYTSVMYNDFSELKRKIIPSYKLLKFVNQVPINSGSERPSRKKVLSPTFNLEINL